MSFTLYHNPRCSKSRQALQLLEERGIQFQIRQYLETPLNREELASLLLQLGKTPRELMRTSEDLYKDLGLANPSLSEENLLAALVEHPRLIERPILSNGQRAVIGRPPENLLVLL